MPCREVSKPFLENWLRRTRRELAGSGKISELALILSGKDGAGRDFWREKIRRILDGGEQPDFELLVEIDSILARPAKVKAAESADQELFYQ